MKDPLRRTLEFLGLGGKDVAIEDAKTYFRWAHGLQCGRPVKKSFTPFSRPGRLFRDPEYHSRWLYYYIFECKFEVLGLETGLIWSATANLLWHFPLFDHYLALKFGTDEYEATLLSPLL